MTALDVDAVGLQNLAQARQAVDGGCSEDDAAFKNFLEQIVKGLRGFFPWAESACEESCPTVPYQMLAILLPANGECLAVEDEDAARNMRIHKNGTREIAMQGTHDRRVLDHALRVSHAAVRASIKHISIMECRPFFSSPFLYAE